MTANQSDGTPRGIPLTPQEEAIYRAWCEECWAEVMRRSNKDSTP